MNDTELLASGSSANLVSSLAALALESHSHYWKSGLLSKVCYGKTVAATEPLNGVVTRLDAQRVGRIPHSRANLSYRAPIAAQRMSIHLTSAATIAS